MNRIIVECSLLFDGEHVHRDARVIIEGEKITAVETIEQANGPEAGAMFRCHFAMPGLIDSHAHAFGYKESPPGIPPFGPHEDVLRLMLYAGVTTVRVLGMDPRRDRLKLYKIAGVQLQENSLHPRMRVIEALRATPCA